MALLLSWTGIATWAFFQTHMSTYIQSKIAQPDNPSYLIILHVLRAIIVQSLADLQCWVKWIVLKMLRYGPSISQVNVIHTLHWQH